MKFLCGVTSWTLDPNNSMKIRENLENVRPVLRIPLNPNTMWYDFSHSQIIWELMNIKICTWRWSWEKVFDLQLTIFNGGGSTSYVRSWHFIEIWPEFAPPSRMATLTPKSRPSYELTPVLHASSVYKILMKLRLFVISNSSVNERLNV